MSALPDPPPTPPRSTMNTTTTAPTGVAEDMDSDDFYDSTSSDDELLQGPPKKVKLTPREPAGDAVKDDAPVPAQVATSPQENAMTESCIDSDNEAPAAVPADTDADGLVATPPPTSPALDPRKDASVAVPETSLSAGTVPDLPPADDGSSSPSSNNSGHFCASDFPIFDPDDPLYEFGDYDCEVFTDPYAYQDYMVERENFSGTNDRLVRHLHECLRGSAATWYHEELTHDQRQYLRYGDLEGWLYMLCGRFRRDEDWYEERMKKNPLNWDYVRENPDVEWWMETQFKRAIALRHGGRWEALHLVWQRIDPELRDDVPEPGRYSGYRGFLKALEGAYYGWRYALGLEASDLMESDSGASDAEAGDAEASDSE